jgi:hypothetical protein
MSYNVGYFNSVFTTLLGSTDEDNMILRPTMFTHIEICTVLYVYRGGYQKHAFYCFKALLAFWSLYSINPDSGAISGYVQNMKLVRVLLRK